MSSLSSNQSVRSKLRGFWISTFWKHPNRLWALKVAGTIALMLIPCVILGEYFIGTTLGMGVVGTALAETDVHPRGRLKSLSATLIGVMISSGIIELLKDYPLVFGIWLVVSTFALTLIGGISSRHQGITFGIILISIYTMLGMNMGEPWYYQPVLLPLGGLVYGLVSVAVLYSRPFRLLEEQLATGFQQLSEYIAVKAQFFPSVKENQETLRNQLAQKNVQVVDQIEQCKNNLNSFKEESGATSVKKIDKFYRLWLFMQEVHERVASSHEQYDVLSGRTKNIELVEGFGQVLNEIGKAIRLYSGVLLTNTAYHHPVSLKWAIAAQKNMLDAHTSDEQYPAFSLLMKNLSELEVLISNIPKIETGAFRYDLLYKGKLQRQSLKSLLSIENARFRFAVRLALCFLAGYLAIYFFNINNGYWIILTSFIVCQQTYTATRQRLLHRVAGTLTGVVLGILLAPILPTKAGGVVLSLVSIYAFFAWLKKDYTVAVVFITVFVLASFNIQGGSGVAAMLPRLTDTLIGSAIVFLVVRFLWPDWQYKQLPELLLNALKQNRRYFDSVYLPNIGEEEYQHNRRCAHNADSALTQAWKGMRLEPKSKRAFQDKAFNLTYLNHALLSYISAFGIHKSDEEFTPDTIKTYKKLSWVLDRAADELSGMECDTDVVEKAKQIESGIYIEKVAGAGSKTILFHNMSRITTELLIEARDLSRL